MNTFVTFRLIFFAAMLALAIGPASYWLARKIGLVDMPGSAPHKQHGNPMPIAGGLVLFVTVFLLSLTESISDQPNIRPILVASAIIFVFGLLDDYKNLAPSWKLIGQVLATAVLIRLGVQVRLFHQEWLNYILTLLWMVGVTNAYNFVDSMDGLATGLASLAAAFFMLVTIDSRQVQLSLFSTILLGACLGSFYYNAPPARFFIGDSGSQFLGFLLAALGIVYNPVGFTRLTSWFVPILLVGIPIFDTTLVVVSRLRRRTPIYQGSRDHTFHRLVAVGMSANRAVLSMHTVALLLGCLAFIALEMPPIIANVILGAVLVLGVAAILFLDNSKIIPIKRPPAEAEGSGGRGTGSLEKIQKS